MPFLSKYGVARHIYIPMVKRGVVDHAVGADWTPAAGDVKISKDGGAAANVTNLPSAIAMGNSAVWDFSLTATEMQAAQVLVTVADSATKAVEDSAFIIETHGNASGQFQVDLADSVRAGLTALPSAAAEAAGGLFTRGSGAGQINQDANGRIDANAKAWNGTAVASPNTAGVPIVDTRLVARTNTAQATGNSTTAVKLDASASATTDFYKGMRVTIISGTGSPESAVCTAYDGTTKIATVAPSWPTAPDNTSVFLITMNAQSDVEIWKGATAPAMTGDSFARLGAPAGASIAADLVTIAGYVDTEVAAILAAVDTEVAAIKAKTDSLTFTVAGMVDANVVDWKGATAPAMTGDAFARLGAPAGASVSADLATIASYVDTEVAAILAAVDTEVAAIKAKTDSLTFTVAGMVDTNVVDWKGATAPAMTGDAFARLGAPAGASVSADLATIASYVDTEVAAILAAVDTEVAAIKAKTDSLTFTVAGMVDANALAINGDATAAANLGKTARVIGRGTCSGVPTTTSIPTSAFDPAGAVADQFKGRIITFDANTATAALRGQSTDITASTSSATPTFSVSALTTAPASGDTFSVT